MPGYDSAQGTSDLLSREMVTAYRDSIRRVESHVGHCYETTLRGLRNGLIPIASSVVAQG